VTHALARARARWPQHAVVFDTFAASYNRTRFASASAATGDAAQLRDTLKQLPFARALRQT
jgi:hypothetical protein